MAPYILPSKVFVYLRRLLLNYEHDGSRELATIVKHGHIAVDPDTDRYFDFGQDNVGHDVVIFLPPDLIAPISLEQQAALSDRLREDLAVCAKGISSEYIHAVRIELQDEDDFLFDMARSLSGPLPVSPDALTFWKRGQIRLFICHRDTYKRQAQSLADALEQFGISCFVAHDTIQPMESWQHEIEKALETMEVFLALVTDDFHNSVWTNQEIGFAKSRQIPVISLKLGSDPQGFIAEKQALRGDKDDPEKSANEIYKLLAEKLGQRDRLQSALITAFCATPNWNEARHRFDRMDELVRQLSDEELGQITAAYEQNDQLYNAIYLHNNDRLRKFLMRTTGKSLKIGGAKIVLESQKEDDEIPF
jgi:hypothetical protein